MLEASRQRLLEALEPDDLVLDIGGWADPLGRADWVLDLMPYETRGLYERNGWIEARGEHERFNEQTWLQRDVCDREPYPFEDSSIDFVVCSHTLEDLRDPVWVCSEMKRVAKAGYIEVPSRLEEQSVGVNGPFVGWSHHRWLIDVDESHIQFVLKLHSLHSRPDQQFPRRFWERLSEEERVQTMWWEGDFSAGERVFLDEAESDRYLGGLVERELAARPLGLEAARDRAKALRRLRGAVSRRLRRGGS
jgi:hypothetical protein